MKETAGNIRRLLNNMTGFRGPKTLVVEWGPTALSLGPPKRSKRHDSNGFVQLHEISVTTLTSCLETRYQPGVGPSEESAERKDVDRWSTRSIPFLEPSHSS